MARTDTFNNWATDVADSIRAKTGKTDKILASKFDTEIAGITTSEDLDEELTDYNTKVTTQKTSIKDIMNVIATKSSGAGAPPEIGVSIIERDENGYTTKIAVYGVTDIPDYGFYASQVSAVASNFFDKSLKEIVFMNDLTSIGKYSFAGLTSLESLTLSDDITTIPDYAFSGCSKLAMNTLPSSLQTINQHAFSGCTKLGAITLPSSVSRIGVYAFYKAGLPSLDMSKTSLTSTPTYMCYYCPSLTDVILPSTLTTLSAYTFSNCTSLKNIVLPDGLKTIATDVFHTCSSLESIDIPDTVTSLGNNQFYKCTSLKTVKLPSGINAINGAMFGYCTSLELKTLPDNITSIGVGAFRNTSAMTQLSMNNVTSMSATNSSQAIFDSSGIKAIWIGSAITSGGLGYYTFYRASNITKMFINLPRATIETFGNYGSAFSAGTLTTSVIICNDDEGFMTKEEFDAIDWSTYEG